MKKIADVLVVAQEAFEKNNFILIRSIVCISMMMHGWYRLFEGGAIIEDFGNNLNLRGFVIGVPIAWSVTLFEAFGGLIMFFGFFSRWISLIWASQLIVGIYLIHFKRGWFVTYGEGGMEYSMLLIAALLSIAFKESKTSTVRTEALAS
jgi:putative oxidoreductase